MSLQCSILLQTPSPLRGDLSRSSSSEARSRAFFAGPAPAFAPGLREGGGEGRLDSPLQILKAERSSDGIWGGVGGGVAFLLGVAGQEDSHFPSGRVDVESFPARDTVQLRIVEIDLPTLESLKAPIDRNVKTQQWTGENLLTVFGHLKSFAESWCPAMPSNQFKVHSFLVVSATVKITRKQLNLN